MFTNKRKIFNDPVYGFISIPYGEIFDLIEHPWFQRLRRIKQLGLTHYVYPGALHTRFHHALGALHLMTQAIDVLRSKGVPITEEEAKAVSIAILLHDMGHGPFSHSLEKSFTAISHEAISLLFMEKLNEEMDGKLNLAIRIFQNQYEKPFLHQLVSSQLDMDRMDYLNRDSFYTGVSEGVIGYDRIIKMLTVREGNLVVEEKGIYSIEKFLIARRLMYWQVYLHKTGVCAEQMLIAALRRARFLASSGLELPVSAALRWFLYQPEQTGGPENQSAFLHYFAKLDDYDIIAALKAFSDFKDDYLLAYLSESILNRRIFRIQVSDSPFEDTLTEKVTAHLQQTFPEIKDVATYLLLFGDESNIAYSTNMGEIQILMKNGAVSPMSVLPEHNIQTKMIKRYFICYPKFLDTHLLEA